MITRAKKGEEIFAALSVKVAHYHARVETGLHIDSRSDRPYYEWPNDPVYESHSTLEIFGRTTYHDNRIGAPIRLAVMGRISTEPPLPLKDIQVTNDDRIPQFKMFPGARYPGYEKLKGQSILQRDRETNSSSVYVFAAPRLLSDKPTLLAIRRQLYLYIHEKKNGRNRWIQSLSRQTTDPKYE